MLQVLVSSHLQQRHKFEHEKVGACLLIILSRRYFLRSTSCDTYWSLFVSYKYKVFWGGGYTGKEMDMVAFQGVKCTRREMDKVKLWGSGKHAWYGVIW